MQTSVKKIEILDCAEEIIQRRGYNGFSYADIAEKVGIRKASIHHHFATKADLGVAVVQRYRERFASYLADVDQNGKNWLDKMRKYTKLYAAVLDAERLCLCGMLASDIETLPKVLKKAIREFFTDNVAWISRVMAQHDKSLSTKRLTDVSWSIIATLQGAIIMAKMLDKPELFAAASKELLAQLENL